MYITRIKTVSTAFTVIILPICGIRAQDREPAAGTKASETSSESASDAKTSGKEPEKSESQKPPDRASEPGEETEKTTMKRVVGIGGVFIKAKDPAKLRAWYKTHLGIDVQKFGGAVFRWVDAAGAPVNGKTAWFVGNGSNFAPSDSSFMINYRVADLRRLLKL